MDQTSAEMLVIKVESAITYEGKRLIINHLLVATM
jgi:hypothetical protein